MIRIISIVFLLIIVTNAAQTDSIITYHDNGKIKSIVHMRDEFRDGAAKFFWDNGNIKQELSYVNGRVEGLVRNYNEDGILREMYSIEEGKREGPTSLFDSTGKYIDDIYYEEGILVVEKIILDAGPKKEDKPSENNFVVNTPQKTTKKKQKTNEQLPPVIEEEKNYEDDPAFYKTVEVMPEPYGGMEALYKKIGYPYEAKEEGIEGTVKAMVFIDRDGEVLDVQIVEGIGYGFDEAVTTSILYHRFKPGLIRGQKVKVQMELTFEFKMDKND